MTRRLHKFKMESGSTISKHLDAFDELVVGLKSLGEPVDELRQLVVLLSSVPTDYELIMSILKNAKNITLIEVKEKALKEHERLQKEEMTKKAFPVHESDGRLRSNRGPGLNDYGPRKSKRVYKGKCFKCNRVGYMKQDYPGGSDGIDEDARFNVGENWLDG